MITSQYLLSQFPSVEFTKFPALRCGTCCQHHICRMGCFHVTRDKNLPFGKIPISMQPNILKKFSAIAPRSVVLLLHRAVFQHLLQDFPDDAQALSRLGNPRGSYEFRGVRWVGRILVVALGVVNSMHELI